MTSLPASTGASTPIISVGSLFKSFDGVKILKNINFTVQEGNLISIIGASGCGKSTLLRCMNYLEIPDSGIISIAGVSIDKTDLSQKFDADMQDKAKLLRSKVGMVFQGLNLFPHKTILENIILAPMMVMKVTRPQAETEAMALLKQMGLEAFSHRYPGNLSGGQAQRVAIARALAMAPKVMLYDEPTSALDPALVNQVLNIMRDLDTQGMTQIVVTHEMRFARDVGTKLVFMHHGMVHEEGPPKELFAAPRTPELKQFISAIA